MKLLVISLEFSCGTFSGNGIYCRSQVRSLAALGHEILALAGCPNDAPDADSAPKEGAAQLIFVPLPTWGRLDRGSSWEAFADGMHNASLLQQVANFKAEFALGIDWSSLPAYRALLEGLKAHHTAVTPPPYVFMNYRVYARSAESAEDYDFHVHYEREAMAQAVLDTALSRSDAEFLEQNVSLPGHPREVKVLLPALRSDMESLPTPADTAEPTNGNCNGTHTSNSRKYLLCCVRLSPEKEPDRFVRLVELLQKRGVFQQTGVVPMLIGPASTPYATELKQRLRTACGANLRIEESFLGPKELAEVCRETVLNVHPCLYDAYGMTIVEAASQGVPSIVQEGGSVGATDLLRGDKGEVILTDLGVEDEKLADFVQGLLQEPHKLRQVGIAACARACSWSERDNASALIQELHKVTQN